MRTRTFLFICKNLSWSAITIFRRIWSRCTFKVEVEGCRDDGGLMMALKQKCSTKSSILSRLRIEDWSLQIFRIFLLDRNFLLNCYPTIILRHLSGWLVTAFSVNDWFDAYHNKQLQFIFLQAGFVVENWTFQYFTTYL